MNKFTKGFTLIELLIVIAVLSVLSAIVLVGIDPLDKIRAANDANAQNTVSSLANAIEAYGVQNNGSYPAPATATDIAALQTLLVSSGDLKIALTVPTGYTITGSSAAASAKLCVNLLSKKYTSTPYWVWSTTSGKAYAAAACL